MEKQMATIRKKTLVSPDMRWMKQTFKNLCIQLSQQNPFTYYEEELINIASGQVAPSEIKDNILTAHKKGYNFSSPFVQQRLIWKQVEFSAPLKNYEDENF